MEKSQNGGDHTWRKGIICNMIGSFESDRMAMTCGVPQESILRTPLFRLYTVYIYIYMLPFYQMLQNVTLDVVLCFTYLDKKETFFLISVKNTFRDT